jgi:CheY-like chemotaxis protein/nitrogen-specific signal transduction histidine kinase
MVRLNQLTQNLRLMAENERRVKEEFVANVSHELRTPLNMIVGFCDMILNSPETYGDSIPPALLADLEVVLRNSRHLSSLIDDVLDLSQIDAGRMALAREWIAFGEIVQDAVIAVRPLVESKNLALSLDIPPDLPRVWCDRIRIREVLLNLLSNAGRFTERGGIVVQCRVEGRHLQVSVADTGPGITQEDTTRLFKPFQQLDSSIRRRYGGTGLGLSISKGFVELHDGEMWVESRKGQGTTFFFKIPLRPVDLPESGPARWLSPYLPHEETPRVPGRESEPVRARLVVVEAGNVMYKLLHRYLPQVEPVPARTLQEGLAMLEQQHAVALLVNQDGVERAAAMIQESGKLPFSIPAILCSIPGTEGAGLGAAGYLVKPVDRGRLLDELGSLDRPVETILVVDDEPDARQLFRRMLASSEQGYRVIRASNGLEALEKMRQEQVDAVLLDLVMPGMDGFQFLVEKNNDAALREIPVILISARDPSGHPIASNALTILRGGGISMKQVVASIETTLALMAPLGLTDPAPPAAPSG